MSQKDNKKNSKKKYQCDKCEVKFAVKVDLKMHVKIHSGKSENNINVKRPKSGRKSQQNLSDMEKQEENCERLRLRGKSVDAPTSSNETATTAEVKSPVSATAVHRANAAFGNELFKSE